MPHQVEGIQKIRDSFLCHDSFLLADEVGLGKTRMACEIAKDFVSVLVIAPLSTFAGWQREAEVVGLNLPNPSVHWVGNKALVNYEKLDKWEEIKSTHWHLVIVDESHMLKSTKTKRWKIWSQIKRTKTLFLSATPGQSPLDLAYLKDVIGFSSFWGWVRSFRGIWAPKWGGLKYNFHPYDKARLKSIFEDNSQVLKRIPSQIQGWPELQRVIYPIKLTPEEAHHYEGAFEDWYNNLTDKQKKSSALVYDLVASGQFRKRISEIKIGATIDLTKTLLDQGKVVVISCEYLHAANFIAAHFKASEYKVGLLTGAESDKVRQTILDSSYRDELDLIIFTIKEGINLHQVKDEHRPRIQIDHDVRWSGLAQHQIDGRTHRAGRNALVYWMVCSESIDETVARVLQSRMKTMTIIDEGSIINEALGFK